jgi:Arc/MetJ-type ribon-helix-helix transcriptional regulator
MQKPSMTMPASMLEQIEERREKGTSRSEYVREAVQARFDAEDAGTWDDTDASSDKAVAES